MYYPCLPFTTLRAIKGRTTQESMPNYSRGYYVQLHCLLEIKMKTLPPCGMLCAAQNNTKRNNLRGSFFPRRMMQDKTFPECDFFFSPHSSERRPVLLIAIVFCRVFEIDL